MEIQGIEIAEDWIECPKHYQRFEFPGPCSACFEEEEIYAMEIYDAQNETEDLSEPLPPAG
jgi:nitrite reductase/ring-hydroxylating ferredoxin subunit